MRNSDNMTGFRFFFCLPKHSEKVISTLSKKIRDYGGYVSSVPEGDPLYVVIPDDVYDLPEYELKKDLGMKMPESLSKDR